MEEQETVVIDIQLQESEVSKRLAEVNGQMAALRKENADLKKSVKDGEKTWKDVSVQLAANEAKLKSLKTEQSALSGQVAKATQTSRKYGDSLKEQSALLADLKNQYQSMTAAEREGAEGQELLKHIQDLDEAVKAADYSQGNFQRNVGNYPDAVKPVTAQLREMTQELIRLRMEGKANTEEYDELLRKTGEMKDAMEDANKEIKQMSSDTGALNSVLGGAQAAAGAFSVALGVMNLVGDKDSKTAKELAEAQQKLQAAIAITTGLQAVQNALQKESALMMGVNKIRLLAAAAAQRAYAAATRDAEAAQVVFNRVAKSNIYVWLAGVILTVVGAIAAFTRGSKEQEDQLKDVNRELNSQLKILQYLNEAYRDLNAQAIDGQQKYIQYLKDTGASLAFIRTQEDEYYRSRLAYLQEEQKRLGFTINQVNQWELAYSKGLVNIEELEKVRRQAMKEGDEDGRIYIENEISRIKAVNEEMKGKIDLYRQYDQQILETRREQEVTNRQREEEDLRLAQEEAERRRRAAENARQHAEQLRREREEMKRNREELKKSTDELIGYFDELKKGLKPIPEGEKDFFDQLREKYEAVDKAAREFKERQELYARYIKETMGIDINFDDSIMEKLEREGNPLYDFAQTYKENAEAIMETSTALESSFGSVAQMYQQMAKDETKTEEERAKAARRAKAWAKIQIATNAGVAVAKGVASAVDVGFPAAIPAMATMLAAILSAIAQANALASEGFETGGVIGGYRGATMGNDNTVASVRTGEMVINAEQQRRLFDIANGGMSTNLTASLVSALQAMPAPVLDYKEFTEFSGRVASLNETAKLK